MAHNLTIEKRMVREIAGVMKGMCNVKAPNITFLSDNIAYVMPILKFRMHPGYLARNLLFKNVFMMLRLNSLQM